MNIDIFNIKGEKVGDYTLDDSYLEFDKGTQAVHDTVVGYLAELRAGTASTKTRAEVSGSGKKQKDTLPVDGLRKIYDDMKGMTYRERMERYSLKPDRADVIIPAAELFLTAAEALGCTTIRVPNISLADCIIDRLYKKNLQ